MKKIILLIIILTMPIIFVFCDDNEDIHATPIEGIWIWTNENTEGTHVSMTINVKGITLVWTSVFNPESTVGAMWESWGLDGSITIEDTVGDITHFKYSIDRIYTVTKTGIESDIPKIPMADYPAAIVNHTLKGSYKLNQDILYLNLNFSDENGEYPTDEDLIYDFVKQ